MRTQIDAHAEAGVFIRQEGHGVALFATPSKLGHRSRRLPPVVSRRRLDDVELTMSSMRPIDLVRNWAEWISQGRGAITELHMDVHNSIRALLIPEIESELAQLVPDAQVHPILGKRIHDINAESASNQRLETGNESIRVHSGHAIALTLPPNGPEVLAVWEGGRASAGAKNRLQLRMLPLHQVHVCADDCYWCPSPDLAGLRKLFAKLHGAFVEDTSRSAIRPPDCRWINAATAVLDLTKG